MLGRPYTGRLPTTQASIDLMNARIRKVTGDMKVLDQQVKKGQIDSRQAGYLKQQMVGEVEELKRAISNSRLSTPSYKVPRDLQQHRARKPANKMISTEHDDGMPKGYFGDDARGNKSSITSDWEATAPVQLRVPQLPPSSPPTFSMWPKHWPGNHSPMITAQVMKAGNVNGKQIINPKDRSFKISHSSNSLTQQLETIQVVKSRYESLSNNMSKNMSYTIGDKKLVNEILNRVETERKTIEKRIVDERRSRVQKEKQTRSRFAPPSLPYKGLDDTNSGNPEAPPMPPQRSERRMPPPGMMPPHMMPPHMMPPPGMRPGMPGMLGRSSGLGAMQAHDKLANMRADRGITPSQKHSLDQATRELTMARARAGSQIDLTKQIKEEPVTRPWTMQVNLSPENTAMISNMIELALSQTKLSQEMFTQQAHNYVATVVNSLSSDLTPTEQTEIVVEKIMSELVNRSGLLRKDIKADIDPNNMSVKFETQQEANIEGLGSALLKTKAAMGRLLG
jgi:hypothetical protein